MHSRRLSEILQASSNKSDYQPVHLCSFPAERTTRKRQKPDAAYYRQKTKKLLKRKNIQFKAIATTGWYSEISCGMHTTTPEVLVRIENHPDAKVDQRKYLWKWEDGISEKIFSLMLTDRREICLESVRETLDNPVKYYPVQRSDDLFSKWSEIRSAIMSELDISQWYSLELFRINRHPSKPVVSIKSIVIADIQETSRIIQDILLRFGVTDGFILLTRS